MFAWVTNAVQECPLYYLQEGLDAIIKHGPV